MATFTRITATKIVEQFIVPPIFEAVSLLKTASYEDAHLVEASVAALITGETAFRRLKHGCRGATDDIQLAKKVIDTTLSFSFGFYGKYHTEIDNIVDSHENAISRWIEDADRWRKGFDNPDLDDEEASSIARELLLRLDKIELLEVGLGQWIPARPTFGQLEDFERAREWIAKHGWVFADAKTFITKYRETIDMDAFLEGHESYYSTRKFAYLIDEGRINHPPAPAL